jgi:dTDP-4-dehydrorhamnose reductase
MSGAGQRGSTVLVVGADGLVGGELFRRFRARGPTVGTSRRADSEFLKLDLAEAAAGWQLPGQVSIAFLCAAVTSLQSCRENPAASKRVNVTNTVALAEQLVASGGRVVFLSTGLVFDGSQPFWRESDAVNPRCEYGRQKAEAERALVALGANVAVVRLAKVVAPGMPLFLRWAEELRAGRSIRPFSDYVMSPISLTFVAQALGQLAARWTPGFLHVGADADVSYADAAARLAVRLGANANLVQPTTSRAAGVDLEIVPQFTTLDTTRLRTELGLATPSATRSLDDCFASL